MTLLQLVNRVLRRLREDEVTDFSDDYTLLIVDFLGEIHEELIEDFDWERYDHTVSTNMVAGTSEYTLSGTTSRSMLRYNSDGEVMAFWYDTAGATQGERLSQISWEEYLRLQTLNTAQQATSPTYVAFHQDNAGTIEMGVWPAPETSDGHITVRFNTPEGPIASETATVSDTVIAPERPLVLGALYLALNERGEELGEPGNIAEQRYLKAVATAKEQEILNRGRVNRAEFYRD